MRDLYALLGVGPGAPLEAIQVACGMCRDEAVRRDAQAVLLNPARRTRYDRLHRRLGTIAQLRANLGHESSPHWRDSRTAFVRPRQGGPGALDALGRRLRSSPELAAARIQRANAAAPPSPSSSSLGAWAWMIAAFVVAAAFIMGTGSSPGGGERSSVSAAGELERMLGEHASLLSGTAAASGASEPIVAAPTRAAITPIRPRPTTGTTWRDSSAPAHSSLQITTRGTADYLVKLVDAGGASVLTTYVRGGEQVTVDVPSGRYDLRYAAGVGWRGRQALFGDSTTAHVADGSFDFASGSWRVTLYTVANGNMSTRTIPIGAF